jgi:hypothetical protein
MIVLLQQSTFIEGYRAKSMVTQRTLQTSDRERILAIDTLLNQTSPRLGEITNLGGILVPSVCNCLEYMTTITHVCEHLRVVEKTNIVHCESSKIQSGLILCFACVNM